ncbi:MAG: NAD-dependent malic enzyme [Pseudomonadota bacterium]
MAKRGRDLLTDPKLNKSTAFSLEERERLGLIGLLPPRIETLDDQITRAYRAFLSKSTPLEQHILLRRFQDENETLFYALLSRHLDEMMPVIYTPTVGEACEKFSEIMRGPHGLFVSFHERDRIDEMLENVAEQDVRVIVVTDGERILGLGDQGAGGMGIPIGKLALYSAAGGIHPAHTLPVLLDCGTNNPDRLKDPLYIGWRHERVTGDAYFAFVDLFVQAVKRRWPNVLLQFEDFAFPHASPLLETYRDQLCTFNDDIQGTAAVAVGTLLAAMRVTGKSLGEDNIVFLGAGSAGCGIAEQTIRAMVRQGVDPSTARSRIFMVDRFGLIHDGMEGLAPFQAELAQRRDAVETWAGDDGQIDLLSTVSNAKPAALLGVSGQPGLFTEEIVRAMAAQIERPVIFPMSNPTSRSEAEPSDILSWTEGRALVATGSPFAPVELNGATHQIAQSNNSYIFPGMGLGILASGARRVTDGMFMAAAEALAQLSPLAQNGVLGTSLLPDVARVREVSRDVAIAVAKAAVAEGVAPEADDAALAVKVDAARWTPAYET